MCLQSASTPTEGSPIAMERPFVPIEGPTLPTERPPIPTEASSMPTEGLQYLQGISDA